MLRLSGLGNIQVELDKTRTYPNSQSHFSGFSHGLFLGCFPFSFKKLANPSTPEI